ncbi:hypothetical protein [Streptomyces sp. NPDC059979]|uniref:hypothetical protein n=1 Tax=Streptomyces sp. NPDC059979 TaxID=3347021 RepID=UPI003684F76D
MTTTSLPATVPAHPWRCTLPASAAKPLDADEERVTRAQRLLVQLGAALVARPFDTRTHEDLIVFLTHDIDAVLVSLAALKKRPESDLQQRIAELAGHTLRSAGGTA